MGERIDFWELLRRPRKTTESWLYMPATGQPVRVSIGRLTDAPGGGWFVLTGDKRLDSLVCRDKAEAERDRHNLGVRLMEMCGPGHWEPAAA